MAVDKSFTWDASRAALATGRRIAIVGGTGGIGRALAQSLAAGGAEVIVVGRTFRDASVPGLDFMQADLSQMGVAKRIGAALPAETLDQLIFTTGVMATGKREVTADGLERDMAISYLSRLVILRGAAPRLGTERPGPGERPRVFVIGYPGSGQKAAVDDLNFERSYGRWKAHSSTVAGNEALVLDAARRYPAIDTFGLNPGFVDTNIRDKVFADGPLYRLLKVLSFLNVPPEDYERRITPLLLASELEGRGGLMFDRRGRAIKPSSWSGTAEVDRLIKASEALVARWL